MTASEQPLLFEGDPVVREHLHSLVALRPHQSVRETKRLLNLWAFYVRLLGELLPPDATGSAQFGRDVMTLAEILIRWLALTAALAPNPRYGSGLRLLIERRNEVPYLWLAALNELNLADAAYQSATDGLRRLLRLHANDEVSLYCECVL